MLNVMVLSGGSAVGLDAASGTVKWPDAHDVGYPMGAAGAVPIVPAAVLIDLWFGGDPKIRPGPDCGYRAADAASTAVVVEGNVGPGAGAAVGGARGGTPEGKPGATKGGDRAPPIKVPH